MDEMKDKWIDANDKLPEAGKTVLLYIADATTERKVFTGNLIYEYNHMLYWGVDCNYKVQGQLIFWMPLPPIPTNSQQFIDTEVEE